MKVTIGLKADDENVILAGENKSLKFMREIWGRGW
jgi:hypothetical protein